MAAETGKQLISSGSSSDNESDHVKDEGAGSTDLRRSFECTFCKRGFTNAQALGGHMNIHRKDRAKAKKTITSSKNTSSYPDDPSSYLMSYRQIAPNMSTSTTDHSRFGNWEAQRPAMMSGNFHMYHPSTMPGALINLPTGGNYYHPEPVRPSQHEMGSNLSLRVGADTSNIAWNNNIENDNHEEEDNNEDVDLELRLGPR